MNNVRIRNNRWSFRTFLNFVCLELRFNLLGYVNFLCWTAKRLLCRILCLISYKKVFLLFFPFILSFNLFCDRKRLSCCEVYWEFVLYSDLDWEDITYWLIYRLTFSQTNFSFLKLHLKNNQYNFMNNKLE